MILTPDNEYCVVPDACVLIPMPLCATVLYLAAAPSLFRMAWSDEILTEVRRALTGPRFGYTEVQVDRRLRKMNSVFPEAHHNLPPGLIEGITGVPDPDDRHVVALATLAHANTIVTENVRHFPEEALAPYNITVSSPDDFLIHQYHLDSRTVLDKLDLQAAEIRKQRSDVLELLRRSVPRFCEVCLGPH
jgi:predicted nucleic acid-binding protein